jgi:putative transposase
VFHVLNRGVRRLQLFDQPADHRAFLGLVCEARARIPIRCLAYCLMPNHFHFVLWPSADNEPPDFMAWLTTTHSKRWHASRGTTDTDTHFLGVCRYAERNPPRAGLVQRAEDWAREARGYGLPRRVAGAASSDWIEIVQLHVVAETQALQQAVCRSAPYGPEDWRVQIASQLGLTSSLMPIGRPRRAKQVTDASA